ncbi:hypothetical protein [Synechococcus sp. M16CYN]|uniref:hypothetical protein n=1 Tax=Synechococcus sp. M16CYN TaxID=3103139 RepID=UPI00333ED09D
MFVNPNKCLQGLRSNFHLKRSYACGGLASSGVRRGGRCLLKSFSVPESCGSVTVCY